MLENLTWSTVLTFLAGALLGGVLTHYIEKVTAQTERRWRVFRRRRKVRKKRHFTQDGYDPALGITTLTPLIPPIDWGDTRDHLKAVIKNSPFFLTPSEDLRDQLEQSQFPHHQDVLPENFHTFMGSTPEALRSLEKARREVTQLFADAAEGSHFNGNKYGVLATDPHRRSVDTAELPMLRLHLYDTDYFTQRVMERVRRTLPELNDTENGQSLPQLNGERNIFRNALGLSIVVELTSTDEILLTRRSAGASYSEGKRWWYVSATEAVSQSDFDRQTKEVDLFDAVHRGVKEELAIERRDIAEIRFISSFFENNFFQDGLVVIVELKDSVDLGDLQQRFAKDQAMEVSELHAVQRRPRHIQQWIQEHGQDARPQTLYTLQCYLQVGM